MKDLSFYQGNERKLFFEDENSLALKSLKDGQVDFADKRVNVKAASMDQNAGAQNLLEVDLGEMTSLKENQVHVKQNQKL